MPAFLAPISRNNGRTIFLHSEVNEDAAVSINMELLKLQGEDPFADITMIVDTYGGDLFSAFSIIDMMNLVTCDVRTICVGKAMSAGHFIFTQGAVGKRLMTPHARLMLHSIQTGLFGAMPDIEVEIKELVKMKEIFTEMIAERSKCTAEQISDMIQRNMYLGPEEAIEYGFADGVISKLKG